MISGAHPLQCSKLPLQTLQTLHRRSTGGPVGEEKFRAKAALCRKPFLGSCALRIVIVPLQVKPMGSHNSSFATKRGLQTPVKSNPLEAVELNDLVNLEVSDGSDEGAQHPHYCLSALCWC